MPLTQRIRSVGRFIPAATMCVALLIVWTSLPSPFHTPKRWTLVAGAALGMLFSWRRWNWAAAPWLAVCALQPWREEPAGLQAIAFAAALVAWPGLRPPTRSTIRGVAIAASLAALAVVLQRFGADPFATARPDVGENRLTLYGTLGNPDFVASSLLPIALLLLSEQRWPRLLPLALLIPALALTRSFGTVLALGAGGFVLLLHPANPSRRRGGLILAAILVGLLIPLLNRPLGNTAMGRAYLVKVSAPHFLESPLWGQGVGATVQRWPDWELKWWQQRCANAACVSRHPEGRFAGLQDHVHNDWLEVLLERGLIGFAALAVVLAGSIRSLWRRRDSFAPYIGAAFAAWLARALIDFPLARPADLCLLALLASLALSTDAKEIS